MEDLAYRRLLDAYYLAERAPQGTVEQVARSVGLRTDLDAVASVLGEFFSSTPEGWINARCERELAAYRERREQAASAGRASVEKRRANARSTDVQRAFNERSTDAQRPLNGRSTSVERTLNHKDKDNYKDKDKPPEIQIARAPANSDPAPRSAPADAGAISQSVSIDASLTSAKAPQSADRPEPAPRGRRKDIVRPEPVQAPLVKWGPLAGDPTPTCEEVIEAWAQAGLPRPTKPSVELVIDRAVRLKPGRDLAWCKRLFERVAKSPWCRGDVHDHPRCQAWSLAHTLGNERRIAQVLEGKYDPEPARERNKPAPRNETQPEHRFTEITREEAAEKAAAKARWTSADGWDEPPIEPMMIEEADEGYMIALTGEIH
jgi:uncharacterized protein YdaU (DUF1376 family)